MLYLTIYVDGERVDEHGCEKDKIGMYIGTIMQLHGPDAIVVVAGKSSPDPLLETKTSPRFSEYGL